MLLSPQGIFDLIMSLGYYPPFVVVQCMFQGNTAPRPSHIAGILNRGCRTSCIARASQNSTADKSNCKPHSQAFYASSFWLLAVCKNGGRRPGDFHHMIHGMTVICHHTSFQQWCMRPILHSVPAAKMGQAPAESCTECMKHTQAKGHNSEKLPSDKH